jgi:hypothetical protein
MEPTRHPRECQPYTGGEKIGDSCVRLMAVTKLRIVAEKAFEQSLKVGLYKS